MRRPETPPGDWRRDPRYLLAASVVAVLAAILLPLAPVVGERPVVSWPQTPQAPTSTALLLSNGTPESLDLRFSCAAAARAQAAGGVLLSTMEPHDPTLDRAGLVVRVAQSSITLATAGEQFPLGPSNGGNCAVRVLVDGGGLTVTRDGQQVLRREAAALPSIDGLITDVGPASNATPDDLAVRVKVVDLFASSPTLVKSVLTVLVALAALALLLMLFVADRSPRRSRSEGREGAGDGHAPSTGHALPTLGQRWLTRLPDLLVILTLVGWLVIAPTTDDDGYYSAMARNASEQGYVGNYFQMWNQSFTPFTWPWQALSLWQHLGGHSVVWLRLPALFAGIVTWFAIRSFTTAVVKATGGLARQWTGYLLGVSFLAWWLPYCMGVRPETLVAMFASLALLLVAKAVETGRVSRAALAATLGGFGVAAHPTGFVVLAPLLVALPTLWRRLRHDHGLAGALVRGAAVVAAGTPAAIAAFGDGTWHDFVAGQARFRAVETPLDWTNEIQRYQFLLSDIPMGSYAKRVPILLAITLLAWFLVLHVAARVGRASLPSRTSLAGFSLLASFFLLVFTPSKWTHHFGSMSGVGPAFLTLLLVTGLPAARELAQRHGRLGVIPWVFAGSLVPAIALGLQGPNVWAYWWDIGMPNPGQAPVVGNVQLGSLAFVIAAFAGVALLTYLWRRRSPGRRPIMGFFVSAVVVVGFLGGTVGYLLWTFTMSTAGTMSTYSPGSANLEHPLGCSASKAVSVYDDRAARVLPSAVPAPRADPQSPFTSGGGYWPNSRPPGDAGDGPRRQVWGSLTEKREAATGSIASDWYALPQDLSTGERLVTFLSGRADGVSSVTAEFGRRMPSGVTTVLARPVQDRESSVTWRADAFATAGDVPAGADVVRLVAYDGETTNGGWLAFTAPERQGPVSLDRYVPADAAVTVSWQMALLFPCVDQLTIRHGITQPPQYAITWPFSVLTNDLAWQVNRGGVAGGASRLGSLVSPSSYLTGSPSIDWGHVYRFRYKYATSAYSLSVEHQVVPGWRGIVPDRVSLAVTGAR